MLCKNTAKLNEELIYYLLKHLFFIKFILLCKLILLSRPSEASKFARELGLKDPEVFNKKALKNVQQKTLLLQETYPDYMDVVITHVSVYISVICFKA